MDSATSIRAFLDAVRRRYLRLRAARAALWAGAALIVVATAAPLWASAAPGRAPVWAALCAAAVILGSMLGLGWIEPRRRWRDRRAAARHVGLAARPVASDLLSSIELLDAPERAAPSSPELTAALVAATDQRCRELSVEALVPRAVLWRPAATLAVAVAVAAAAWGLWPERLARGWQQLAAGNSAPFSGAALVDVPVVGDIEIRLDYPAYSGRPPVTLPSSSGDFAAMVGTRVTLSTTALAPTRSARLLLSADERGEGAVSEVELEVQGDRVEGAFTIGDAHFYRFLIETPAGERRVEAEPHRIEIEPDRAPTVQLHVPAEELDVADLERVEIAYVAEDDYGIRRAELVIGDAGEPTRLPLPVPEGGDEAAPRAAQSKYVWDLADLRLEPGVRIPYHVEVFDNDDVDGPNVGRSQSYTLRVFSPRERHEEVMARQRELAEHMLEALAARLTVDPGDVAVHRVLRRRGDEIIVELGTVVAALEKDELAADELIADLSAMRERLGQLASAEEAILARLGPDAAVEGRAAERLARSDQALVAELEDDVLRLADWLERQQVENLLAISDEIEVQRERLDKLMAEYARTGSEEIRAEIERELRNLEQRLAQLAERRTAMPADVLDRFVNTEALDESQQQVDCLGQVRELLDAGDIEAAQAKMKECAQTMDESAQALEEALREFRGERFSEAERNYEQLMSELADLSRDQSEVAEEADALYQRYADEAAERMKDSAGETKREVGAILDRLRGELDKVPRAGLTPFASEEMDILKKRLDDVERRLAKGDVADALAMARQAEASLEVLRAELETALEEGWNRRARDAARAVQSAQPAARELVEKLAEATPAPEDILNRGELRKLDRLRRRQQSVLQRSQRLARRAQELDAELPGESGQAMAKGLGEAGEQMERATARMRARDPSGARQEARDAAESLSRAQEQARGAARLRQDMGQTGLRDEPVRIPGADEYQPPAEFREQILDAMKEEAPAGYGELVERYYQELIK